MRHKYHDLLSLDDFLFANKLLDHKGGIATAEPDLIIAPDGQPYLYRWHLIPRNEKANVYFHIQVASDPERPLHDHPWDNTSVILSGGYDEVWDQYPMRPGLKLPHVREIRKGDCIHRKATEAHRLILPSQFNYAMTIFSTGPTVRKWGFWFPEGWRDADEVTHMENGQSVMDPEQRNG